MCIPMGCLGVARLGVIGSRCRVHQEPWTFGSLGRLLFTLASSRFGTTTNTRPDQEHSQRGHPRYVPPPLLCSTFVNTCLRVIFSSSYPCVQGSAVDISYWLPFPPGSNAYLKLSARKDSVWSQISVICKFSLCFSG